MLKQIFITAALAVSTSSYAGSIYQELNTSENLTYLKKAVEIAELGSVFENLSNATVFLPTDSAFENLKVSQLKSLMADKENLKKILLDHVVVEGSFTESELVDFLVEERAIYTAAGNRIFVGGTLRNGVDFLYSSVIYDCDQDGDFGRFERIAGATVTKPNIKFDNNVTVHLMDQINPRGGTGYALPVNGIQIIGYRCNGSR